jgi:pimeloyl-ACP methyl ester carboxylesterase
MTGRSGGRRRARLTVTLLGFAMICALVSGLVYERLGERRDRQRLPQIGRSVDIGGRSLNIYCSGEGSPAVIFDAGNGEPGYVWSGIQPEVAKLTRACWFDRAGEGWSDMGSFPRTSAAMSTDLHALLHRVGIPAPYVLVGESRGGMNARVYNGMYPRDVAGAVLVDASHGDEATRAPAFMLGHSVSRTWWHPIWIAGQVARVTGVLRLTLPTTTLPTDSSRRTRDVVVRALRNQPAAVATQFDASDPDSYAQAERAADFADLPLIVLTRGKIVLPSNPGREDRESAAYELVWQHEIQPKLARLSTRGQQVIVARSSHEMDKDAPEAIVDAIRRVLDVVRERAASADVPPHISRDRLTAPGAGRLMLGTARRP